MPFVVCAVTHPVIHPVSVSTGICVVIVIVVSGLDRTSVETDTHITIGIDTSVHISDICVHFPGVGPRRRHGWSHSRWTHSRWSHRPRVLLPEKLNIPVVAVVDTDAPVHSVDYPIPANTRSLRFYHTLSYALVRAVNDGRAVRADLEAHSTAPLAGDGGGARGATSGDGGDARRQARAPLPFRAPDRFGRPADGPRKHAG